MRILITGAGGLLGGRLCDLLADRHELIALTRYQRSPEGVRTVTVDLADAESVASTLKNVEAEMVIHCAALADPEVCEREPERGRRDNVQATGNVARACAEIGARLISLSTDLVFNGSAAFSSESTTPEPLMEYGRTKLAAESAAQIECPGAVVLRVALICGKGYGPRLSASESVARRLDRGEGVTLYEDEWRTPTDPESIASAIEAVVKNPGATGVFHIAGAERVTRAELGARVANVLGLDTSLIRYASASSHVGARRPADISLGIDRARTELGWTPRPLDAALREGRRQ